MRRSEWTASVLFTLKPAPCSKCGQRLRAYHVTDEGDVCAWCGTCEAESILFRVTVPAVFVTEPDDDAELPV